MSKGTIALVLAVIGGVCLFVFAKDRLTTRYVIEDTALDPTPASTPTPATPSRDAATGNAMIAGGAAIMPDDLTHIDPSDYSVELAKFIPVEVGMDGFAAKDEFLVYYNSELGPTSRVSMTEKTVDGATVFLIRRLGLQDDSVSGEESYAVFDAGKLAAYGTRIQCARGAEAGNWTTELCP